MNIGKLSYWCRKIHRWSLWFVVIFGLIQMITGLSMKYPEIFFFVNQKSARLLHFQTAGWFALAFGIQMFTGLVVYFTPMILKRFRNTNLTN